MQIFKKLFIFSLVLVLGMSFTLSVQAMTPTLSLSSNGTNSVLVSVTGDPYSNVVFYYNLSYGTQSAILGTTNSNGFFSTTVNPSSYGLTSGSLVYVTVNNQQSPSASWPANYSYPYGTVYPNNTYGFLVSNLNLSVGNSITLGSPTNSGLYVASNSHPAVAGVGSSNINSGCYGNAMYSVVNGQPCYLQNYYQTTNNNLVTISALSAGTTTITLCQSNNSSACSAVSINVSNSNYVYNSGVYNSGAVLGASTCYLGNSTLRYGMSGASVSCLQNLLAAKGFLVNSYSSYFDAQTQSAVMAFQQNYGLYPDGIVGLRTRSALMTY